MKLISNNRAQSYSQLQSDLGLTRENMFSSSTVVCTTLTIILLMFPMADVQMAMPMYPMNPMMQQFPPPFGFGPQPMPMPMPMQLPIVIPPIAVPAIRPPETITQKPKPKAPDTSAHKPPCPPCFCFPCVPAFFSYCSPCHLKCRCKDPDSAPEPLPASNTEAPQTNPQQMSVAFPLPAPGFGMMPPPVVVIPVPPMPPVQTKDRYKKRKYSQRGYPSSEEESRENYKNNRFVNSWDTNENENKRKHRNRTFRRMFYEDDKEEELIKPFLSFVSSDGDIRFKTKLSNVEAAKLLSDRKPQEESLMANQDLDLEKGNKQHNNIQVFRRKGKTAKVIVTV